MRTHAPPPDRRIDTEAPRPQRPQERSLRSQEHTATACVHGGSPPVQGRGHRSARRPLREGQRAHPVRPHRTTRPGTHRRPGPPKPGHGTGLRTAQCPAYEAAHGDQQHQGGDTSMTEATLPRHTRIEVAAGTAPPGPGHIHRQATRATGTGPAQARSAPPTMRPGRPQPRTHTGPGHPARPARPAAPSPPARTATETAAQTGSASAAHRAPGSTSTAPARRSHDSPVSRDHTRTPVPATRPDTLGPPLARRLPEPQGRRRRSPALAGTRTTPTGHQPRPPNPILVWTRLRRRGVSPGGRRRTCSPGGWCRSRLSPWGGGRV